ncbi:hypothetical protein HHK36_002516 [Tetracentron sinense]|uniref:Eukaryotic translation initiation factor 5A n=1 Tax=Tetracentron sinense TaxID=13715 RepID=A0A835DNE6_TETSI|nr:hypothetical protein HHK36_002516 [Tetracentron sinense]
MASTSCTYLPKSGDVATKSLTSRSISNYEWIGQCGLLGLQRPLLQRSLSPISTTTGKHGHAKCHFVAIDIFNGKKLEDIVPSSHNYDVRHVNGTDYQLIDISEDGFVGPLTENGNTKDDLKLPINDDLLSQIKDGFA